MKKWIRDGLKGAGIGIASLTLVAIAGIAISGGFSLGHVGFKYPGGYIVGVPLVVVLFGVPVGIFGFFFGVLIGSRKEKRLGQGKA